MSSVGRRTELWVASPSSVDPRIPKVDDRGMLHATAAGKAIAAQLADERVLTIISIAGLPQPTVSTLGSPNGLLRELHRVRGEGFAISPGVGETMAEVIATGASSIPIAPFSIGRFAQAETASQARAA